MNTLQAALVWLDQLVSVLPIQPNTKHLVSGFGQHGKRITTAQDAALWFNGRAAYNLAVCCPSGLLALDFDSNESFYSWQESLPTELTTTYQETTPRGWHVFYWGSIPHGIRLKPGIEIKPVLCVSPSVVNRFRYTAIDYPIKRITDQQIKSVFSFLLSEEKDHLAPAPQAREKPLTSSTDIISRIKEAVSVYNLAASLTELVSSDHGRGRWWKGKCPFHGDEKPSFWVDVKRGLWGCFACGITGDVINLYAKAHGLSTGQAISNLSREVIW